MGAILIKNPPLYRTNNLSISLIVVFLTETLENKLLRSNESLFVNTADLQITSVFSYTIILFKPRIE